jgi:hypothetical protein
MDGLDVYIDDYSKEDPIAPAMLAQLQHARSTLFDGPAEEEETTPPETADKGPEINPTTDGACP